MLGNQASRKMMPGLRAKKKGEGLLVLGLVIMASFGGAFGSLWVDENYLHRPLDVFGVCPPPAQISAQGCFKTEIQTVNGQARNVTVPAGYLLYINNGTAYKGAP